MTIMMPTNRQKTFQKYLDYIYAVAVYLRTIHTASISNIQINDSPIIPILQPAYPKLSAWFKKLHFCPVFKFDFVGIKCIISC